MATRTVKVKNKIAYSTRADWMATNKPIDVGVMCYESDTGRAKVGDGLHLYSELGYMLIDEIIAVIQQGMDARDEAVSAKEHFDKWYLGPKDHDPNVDNAGDPLEVGALYNNTVSTVMRFWNGTSWQNAYTSVTQEVSIGSYVITGIRETHPQPGCLLCTGAGVTPTYPVLRAILIADGSPYGTDENGNPRLPKWGGFALRGWLPDQLVDSGRIFGSEQGDAIRNIKSTNPFEVQSTSTNIGGPFANVNSPAQNWSLVSDLNIKRHVRFDASLVVPTADENRMINQTAIFWMKAYSTEVDVAKYSWVDATASRSADTWYKNDTGRIAYYFVQCGTGAGATITATAKDLSGQEMYIGQNKVTLTEGNADLSLNVPLPPGWEIKFTTTTNITAWREMVDVVSHDNGTSSLQIANMTNDINQLTAKLEALENSKGSSDHVYMAGLHGTTFSGIPAGVNHIHLSIVNFSSSVAANWLLTLGSASGIVESGYTGSYGQWGSSAAYNLNSTGFIIFSNAAPNVQTGHIWLTRTLANENLWEVTAHGSYENTPYFWSFSGRVILPAELTQVKVELNVSGATNDSGSIRLFWEK